jgi:hypothetical protein
MWQHSPPTASPRPMWRGPPGGARHARVCTLGVHGLQSLHKLVKIRRKRPRSIHVTRAEMK